MMFVVYAWVESARSAVSKPSKPVFRFRLLPAAAVSRKE